MMDRIALVGSPNSGKTTLFNALTGSRQKTANYAGVTVEKKEGLVALKDGLSVALLDLPGAYSLDARTPDEAITAEMVFGARADEQPPRAIIAVADSTNLERNLYLVLQLRELGLPMVVALTMSDLAKKAGLKVHAAELEKRLGVPVVVTSAVKKTGLDELKHQVRELLDSVSIGTRATLKIDNSPQAILKRYQQIEDTVKAAMSRSTAARDATRAIDRVVLHRVWGPLLLVLMLAFMFQSIFSFARIPMDAIQAGVDALQAGLRGALPAGDLRSLLVDGVLGGVGAVVVFLPQILLLFTFIILFEDSGYMARAAFILDRLMARVGLHGRAFIPLLSSFACAIPGIMATRTIENRRDRLVTILVSPLMTCSARIPVYTLLIGSFIPATAVLGPLTMQGAAMLGLYAFGVSSALIVAAVFRRTLLAGEKSTSFVMELPTYKVPSLRNLVLGLWDRARIFLRRAGTIILGVSIVLWFLATFPKAQAPTGFDEKAAAAYQLEHSFAGRAGHLIEPAIRPLGYDWKIGVALLSSFAAREVVISSLGTVYAVGAEKENRDALVGRIHAERGFTLATAVSLLIFYALACQCMSTIAIVRRETNSWRWPAVMFGYMTLLAYGGAFAAFHLLSR
jgi:ferrous iron transport protein B